MSDEIKKRGKNIDAYTEDETLDFSDICEAFGYDPTASNSNQGFRIFKSSDTANENRYTKRKALNNEKEEEFQERLNEIYGDYVMEVYEVLQRKAYVFNNNAGGALHIINKETILNSKDPVRKSNVHEREEHRFLQGMIDHIFGENNYEIEGEVKSLRKSFNLLCLNCGKVRTDVTYDYIINKKHNCSCQR
jgi:hypothetical protein